MDILCHEADLNRERLLQYGVARCVLMAWWVLEDHGSGWERSIAAAKIFLALLQPPLM